MAEVQHLPTARRTWLCLIPLLLLSFGLGAHGLNANPPSHDEWRTIWHVADERTYEHIGIDATWREVRDNNPWHVPGYFVLTNLWSRAVGLEIAALRALPLLLGALAVALTYRIGAEQFSPRVGLLAATLLGGSAFFVRYFYKARTYSLVALATAFTLWLYFRIMNQKREPTRLEWLGLLAGALLLLYSHYLAALLLIPLGLVHLWLARRGTTRRWWGVVGVMIAAGLLFLPWATALIDGLGLAAEEEELNQRALAPLPLTFAFLERFSNAMPFLLIPGAAAFWSARRAARPLIFISGGLLLALVGASAATQITSPERLRYFMGLWIPLALALGVGFDQLWRWQPRIGRIVIPVIVAAWVAMGARLDRDRLWFSIASDSRMESAYGAYQRLRERVLPGDHVVAYVPDGINWRGAQVMLDYFWRAVPVNTATVGQVAPVDQEDRNTSPFEDASIEQLRLWLVDRPGEDNSALPSMEAQLAALDFALCEAPTVEDGHRVSLYARAPVCCAAQPAQIRYGDSIELMGMDAAYVDGDAVITTAWHFSGVVPPDTYSVSFQLFDERGEKIAQLDEGLASLVYACKRVVVDLPDDLPPGTVQARAAVYAWRSGERLPAVYAATGETGDLLTIGEILLTAPRESLCACVVLPTACAFPYRASMCLRC